MSLRRKLLSPMITNRSFLSSSKSLNEFRVPECDFDNDATILKITGGGNDDSRRIDTTEVLNAEEEKAWSWSNMLPEILGEIVRRVEARSQNWPERRNVVACGCVCRQWREVTKEIVKFPCGSINNITFPSCLKKPGACDYPIQCLIEHDKKNAMFYLYLALSSSSMEKGKFLLVARRYRNGANSEYIISLDADDFSQGSNAYVGKLRSDIIGSNFTVYDSQPPYPGAKSSSCRARRRFASKRISPQVHAGNYAIGEISYKFNFLRSRSPRRMVCAVRCPSSDESAINVALDDLNLKGLQSGGYTVLKNRLPKWHEHLQCWCLNFHGRVTVASVKNFQLVATMDQSQPGGKDEDDTVVLQFGKVGDGIFTMDFIQPLSAFQAFAICLTSFGTKLACD